MEKNGGFIVLWQPNNNFERRVMVKKRRLTKLEKAVVSYPEWRAIDRKVLEEIKNNTEALASVIKGRETSEVTAQRKKILNNICDEVVSSLSPSDLCESVVDVYGSTTKAYKSNAHTDHIIDELVVFMNMLEPGSLVLDIGCGYGRDVFYMSFPNRRFREELMGRAKEKGGKTTLEKFLAPKHAFRAIGIDGAEDMITAARTHLAMLEREYAVVGTNRYPRFIQADMHDNLAFLLRDRANRPLRFDGIWSCTSLFTHTPRQYLRSSMSTVARLLEPKGILFVSYTNGRANGKYDKLVLSSTGRIKWFSHPDPDEVVALAAKCGLELMEPSTFNDYAKGSDFTKDLFVSHFFRKKG